MKIKSVIIIILLQLIFISCQKQPTSAFTKDQETYAAGDTISLTNRSEDAHSYQWTLPNGTISNAVDIEYPIPLNEKIITYTFKLEAFSKSGSKKSEQSKAISITEAKGDFMIWKSNTITNDVTVTIDNDFTATVFRSFDAASPPYCGEFGTATLTATIGNHTIHATDGTHVWNDTITVIKDNCIALLLQ